MPNYIPTRAIGPVRAPYVGPSRQLVNSYNSRPGRNEVRAGRRRGDWDFDFPTALLWSLDVCAAAAVEDDLECPAPGLIDLWP
jgi:hypothetical protein